MLVNTVDKVVTIDLLTIRVEPEKEELYIYPNPAKDKLYINAAGISEAGECRLRIINQTGVTVFETRVKESQTEIDITDWKERGIYFIQVADSEGRVMAMRKIIFQ